MSGEIKTFEGATGEIRVTTGIIYKTGECGRGKPQISFELDHHEMDISASIAFEDKTVRDALFDKVDGAFALRVEDFCLSERKQIMSIIGGKSCTV